MISFNKRGVIENRYQNIHDHKRVVTVCSAGCLRSPTAAVVLAGDGFKFNTRPVGITEEYAIIPLTEALAFWADEFVVMEDYMIGRVEALLETYQVSRKKPIICLDIPDNYDYRNDELMKLIADRYMERTNGE